MSSTPIILFVYGSFPHTQSLGGRIEEQTPTLGHLFPLSFLSAGISSIFKGVFDSMFIQMLTSSLTLASVFQRSQESGWCWKGRALQKNHPPSTTESFRLHPFILFLVLYPSYLFLSPPIRSFRSNQPELITVERNIAPNSFGKFPLHCEDVQPIPLSEF